MRRLKSAVSVMYTCVLAYIHNKPIDKARDICIRPAAYLSARSPLLCTLSTFHTAEPEAADVEATGATSSYAVSWSTQTLAFSSYANDPNLLTAGLPIASSTL